MTSDEWLMLLGYIGVTVGGEVEIRICYIVGGDLFEVLLNTAVVL